MLKYTMILMFYFSYINYRLLFYAVYFSLVISISYKKVYELVRRDNEQEKRVYIIHIYLMLMQIN